MTFGFYKSLVSVTFSSITTHMPSIFLFYLIYAMLFLIYTYYIIEKVYMTLKLWLWYRKEKEKEIILCIKKRGSVI